MKTKQIEQTEIRAEWEQYQHEMANGYGFGHTSGKGPRNFAAFCAAKRLESDTNNVRNERWSANGVRLKDTPEWCTLYVAARR